MLFSAVYLAWFLVSCDKSFVHKPADYVLSNQEAKADFQLLPQKEPKVWLAIDFPQDPQQTLSKQILQGFAEGLLAAADPEIAVYADESLSASDLDFTASPGKEESSVFFHPARANVSLTLSLQLERVALQEALAAETPRAPFWQAQTKNFAYLSFGEIEELKAWLAAGKATADLTRCSFALKVSGQARFASIDPQQPPASAAEREKAFDQGTTLPILFYSLLPSALPKSTPSDCTQPTNSEVWRNYLTKQLVVWYGPIWQEYLKLHGSSQAFAHKGDDRLVEIDLGQSWGLARGDSVDFYKLSYHPLTAELKAEKLAEGTVSLLMNNYNSWVRIEKTFAQPLQLGSYALQSDQRAKHPWLP